MKKLLLLPVILFAMVSCKKENDGTAFGAEALEAKMKALDGTEVAFKDILERYKGKTVVIDVWASWCPDCIKGMPKVHKLQSEFPDVKYIFLSYDREDARWKEGITKYGAVGDNYHVGTSMKEGAFAEDIKLDWIPRYMVIDKDSKIALFKAIEADDPKLTETLNKLK
ncbi:alkyl hydroperoxide reductase [Flavobacterium akiainvivens]|uniref:Alkyl hydroperoxide reductase n=1 Tax=Flavobacterium akiainvivens TaxID=1202724 RepID=A0A0N0RQN5_9FLAO|nr:TlpA disulfide reductase family protein [Flavobacterium akiainvivens]KOS05949.1 alkyl hydroperoxide reductase [Flavobacterium akiainvivens]SFQ53557.1 Redoxin [Flavobacterium akiainvivens]